VPETVRDRSLKWLSRVMFLVAGVAAFSLVAQYGFYLSDREQSVLSVVDLAIVGVAGRARISGRAGRQWASWC